MRWQDDLVAIATRSSHVAVKKRQEAAVRRYRILLRALSGLTVSTQVLKDTLGMSRPHTAIRTMARLGMIKKVRHIPQHWEYEIVEEKP